LQNCRAAAIRRNGFVLDARKVAGGVLGFPFEQEAGADQKARFRDFVGRGKLPSISGVAIRPAWKEPDERLKRYPSLRVLVFLHLANTAPEQHFLPLRGVARFGNKGFVNHRWASLIRCRRRRHIAWKAHLKDHSASAADPKSARNL
jgi:hypothetical protein